MVHRDVIRLVTPGTLTEDTLLDAGRNNYLLAVARARLSSAGEDAQFALAWIDISTGEFRVTECDRASLSAEIARLEPARSSFRTRCSAKQTSRAIGARFPW